MSLAVRTMRTSASITPAAARRSAQPGADLHESRDPQNKRSDRARGDEVGQVQRGLARVRACRGARVFGTVPL